MTSHRPPSLLWFSMSSLLIITVSGVAPGMKSCNIYSCRARNNVQQLQWTLSGYTMLVYKCVYHFKHCHCLKYNTLAFCFPCNITLPLATVSCGSKFQTTVCNCVSTHPLVRGLSTPSPRHPWHECQGRTC